MTEGLRTTAIPSEAAAVLYFKEKMTLTEIKGKVHNGEHMTGKQKEDYISSLITTIESLKTRNSTLERFVEQSNLADMVGKMNPVLELTKLQEQMQSLQAETVTRALFDVQGDELRRTRQEIESQKEEIQSIIQGNEEVKRLNLLAYQELTTEYAEERAQHNIHVTELCKAGKVIAAQKEEIETLKKAVDEYLCFVCEVENGLNEPRGTYSHPVTCAWRLTEEYKAMVEGLRKVGKFLFWSESENKPKIGDK